VTSGFTLRVRLADQAAEDRSTPNSAGNRLGDKRFRTRRTQLRRRFCGPGWRIAHNGVVFTGASSVAVTRYRYRGANIPTPWTPTATSG
jgi:hypothetical protein